MKSKHGFSFVNRLEEEKYRLAIEEAKKEKTEKALRGAAGVALGLYQWTLDSTSFEIPGTGIQLGVGDIYMLTTGINPLTGKPATDDDYRSLALGITVGATINVASNKVGTDHIENAIGGPERIGPAPRATTGGSRTGPTSTPGVTPTSVAKPSPAGSSTSPNASGSASMSNTSGTGPASTHDATPTPGAPAPAGTTPAPAASGSPGAANTSAAQQTAKAKKIEELKKQREKQRKDTEDKIRTEKLKEGIQEAEARGKLDELNPADRTWVDADPRHKDLAYDPDQKKFKVEEGRASLQAEKDGILDGPVIRSIDEHGGGGGGDYFDGKGKLWDLKDARDGAQAIADAANPKGGQPGENILVDCSNFTVSQQKALERAIKRRLKAGSSEVRFVPKR